MRILFALTLTLVLILGSKTLAVPPAKEVVQADAGENPSKRMVFPDGEWMRCAPQEQGLAPGPLEEVDRMMKVAEANGLLLRNGYLVADWNYGGSRTKRFHAMSIGKSFTTLVLGLALEDNLIPSLDATVKEVYPAFEAGPFTERITFRHLATMTSGIVSSRHQMNYTKLLPPGTALVYHADQYAHLARVLTYVYGKTLHSVLKERILDPIGSEAYWEFDRAPWSPVVAKNGKEVPVNAGFGNIHFTASDLARVGHLFVNYGRWKGEQLISAAYIKECWTEIPQKPLRPNHWGTGYGLGWWRLVPGVWCMSGWGGQFCMVWPEYGVVMVKLNAHTREHTNLEGRKNFGDTKIFPFLYRSLTGEDFVVPLEWKMGWRARGSADGVWEIPLAPVAEK